MARKSADTMELPGMETPKDAKVENASRKYRQAISLRLEQQKDEANQKAKLTELVLAWAERNTIKPVIFKNEKGAEFERYIYKRGDIEAIAERPVKWNVKVLLGDEIPDDEGDASAVADDVADGETE